MPEKTVKKILVVKLRALGDVLTTFPLLRALKELYPHAQLTMLADEQYQDLLQVNPRVDVFWPHPARQLHTQTSLQKIRQQWEVIRRIRQSRFDLYLDLYGSLRTAQWGFFGGIPRRLGFDLRGRKYFYTDRIRAAHRYVVDLNLQFAQALGWQGKNNTMEFFVTPEDEAAARAFLLQQGVDFKKNYVVASPGGGWPLKRWSAEKMGQVLKTLAARTGCQVVISGSTAEAGLMAACAHAAGPQTCLALDLPLRQLAAVIRNSRIFIGNDSGPKYFAESYQVPTVICYGPTDFENNNPKSERHLTASKPLPCRPCHSETCKQGSRICLDSLEVEDVLPLVLDVWEKGKNTCG